MRRNEVPGRVIAHERSDGSPGTPGLAEGTRLSLLRHIGSQYRKCGRRATPSVHAGKCRCSAHPPLQWMPDTMIRKPRHVLRRAMTDALVSLTLAVSACFATALPARAAAGQLPCAADGQGRALDFWLGHWTVSDDEQPRSATSVVSRALGECLVVESWSDAAGHRG